jgi:DNA-binding NtrC family response regulator
MLSDWMSSRVTPDSLTVTAVSHDRLEIPSAQLEVTAPGAKAVVTPLGLQPLTLGSDETCDVVIADPRVSRRHCTLELNPNGLLLRDLDSKNGTYVGAMRIREVYLGLGTSARIGDASLIVRLIGPPARIDISPRASFGEALGGTPRMRALFARLEIAAQTSETVVLLGETGTGKELLARAIHQAGNRRDGPFVVFDCGAVAANLIEAELFGHARGAFTDAQTAREGILGQANGGVLFLDEIGELAVDLQPKLLRALESRQYRPVGSNEWRPFDARIVAATHKDLRQLVRERKFREDLYFRLAVVEVKIPPLRERRDDIELITERILASQVPPRSTADLGPGTLDMLRAYDWPGNVRELRNALSRLMVFPDLGAQAFTQDLQAPGRSPVEPGVPGNDASSLLHLTLRAAREHVVEDFEVRYISAMLRAHEGNISRAAASMGVSRQLLHRLIERYGLRTR